MSQSESRQQTPYALSIRTPILLCQIVSGFDWQSLATAYGERRFFDIRSEDKKCIYLSHETFKLIAHILRTKLHRTSRLHSQNQHTVVRHSLANKLPMLLGSLDVATNPIGTRKIQSDHQSISNFPRGATLLDSNVNSIPRQYKRARSALYKNRGKCGKVVGENIYSIYIVLGDLAQVRAHRVRETCPRRRRSYRD